jgi:hypothetical protein
MSCAGGVDGGSGCDCYWDCSSATTTIGPLLDPTARPLLKIISRSSAITPVVKFCP